MFIERAGYSDTTRFIARLGNPLLKAIFANELK